MSNSNNQANTKNCDGHCGKQAKHKIALLNANYCGSEECLKFLNENKDTTTKEGLHDKTD